MAFNAPDVKPLIDDEFVGDPAKRTLQYIQSKRSEGMPVVGIYCGYAPMELIRAVGAVPAILCAFANKTIAAAESVLPGNLCPLIKSSYGFIITDTCPFFALSDAVVAETTCGGKKKMFELISHYKPMFVMGLPQLPDEEEAQKNWATMITKLQGFLEKTFARTAVPGRIEEEIKATNIKNSFMNRVFDYAAKSPPLSDGRSCTNWLFWPRLPTPRIFSGSLWRYSGRSRKEKRGASVTAVCLLPACWLRAAP
jgi:benzoyl-CoA reductase/2-hydroxyglutaryl-CoA dehydratase subunit BcrC/BadD/HgdB